MNGVLLIDKPPGMTSHDVVDRIRRVSRMRRVGHTGTLDPMATGLLGLCIGPATRIVQFLTRLPKKYEGTIRLGAISSTYDGEGEIVAQDKDLPTRIEDIAEVMGTLTGIQTQLAPPYSAVKVKGKKLYEYAREGLTVPQKPREVLVKRFDALISACTAIAAVASKGDRHFMVRTIGEVCITVGERIDGASLEGVRIGNERRMTALDAAGTELVKPDCPAEYR